MNIKNILLVLIILLFVQCKEKQKESLYTYDTSLMFFLTDKGARNLENGDWFLKSYNRIPKDKHTINLSSKDSLMVSIPLHKEIQKTSLKPLTRELFINGIVAGKIEKNISFHVDNNNDSIPQFYYYCNVENQKDSIINGFYKVVYISESRLHLKQTRTRKPDGYIEDIKLIFHNKNNK